MVYRRFLRLPAGSWLSAPATSLLTGATLLVSAMAIRLLWVLTSLTLAGAQAQDVQQTILDNHQLIQQSTLTAEINGLVLKTKVKSGDGGAEKDFSYNPAPRIRNEVLDRLVQRLKLPNLEQLRQLDYNQRFTQLATPYGLRPDDAADLVTAYQVWNWVMANQAPMPKPGSVAAVRRSVAKVLSQNREIYHNAGKRALLGEEMKLLVVLTHLGWQGAQQQGKTQAYSDGIQTQYQQRYGQNLRQLKLDVGGLHP